MAVGGLEPGLVPQVWPKADSKWNILFDEAGTISWLKASKLSKRNVRKMFAESTVATPLKVEIQDMAVTGLSPCCKSFRQVFVATSQTRTVHPEALKAIGIANKTFVIGPEWPVKVQTGEDGEPKNQKRFLRSKNIFRCPPLGRGIEQAERGRRP